MTVGELIEALREMPRDVEIAHTVYNDGCGSYDVRKMGPPALLVCDGRSLVVVGQFQLSVSLTNWAE